MELIGQDHDLNEEFARYCSVSPSDIRQTARKLFTKKNCSILYYKAKEK
jgi:hypothetical protein